MDKVCRILQNIKSCVSLVSRCHQSPSPESSKTRRENCESPSPPAASPPGGAPAELANPPKNMPRVSRRQAPGGPGAGGGAGGAAAAPPAAPPGACRRDSRNVTICMI